MEVYKHQKIAYIMPDCLVIATWNQLAFFLFSCSNFGNRSVIYVQYLHSEVKFTHVFQERKKLPTKQAYVNLKLPMELPWVHKKYVRCAAVVALSHSSYIDLLMVREMACSLQGLISMFYFPFIFILKTAIKNLILKIGKKPVFHLGKCGSKSRYKLHVEIGFSATKQE